MGLKTIDMNLFRFLILVIAVSLTQLVTAQEQAISQEIATSQQTTLAIADESPEISNKNINWYTWEEAIELTESNPKKIFVDIYTNWCHFCKKMDKTTFKDPEVITYINENFYPVKFNAEQKEAIMFNEREFTYYTEEGRKKGIHLLAYALLDGQLGFPAFVTLDETFARIMISPGYKLGPQLMQELTFANDEKYKEMSWEDYQKGE
jgi:thioredoxin-related protein